MEFKGSKFTMSLGWAIDSAREGLKVKCNLECASEDYLYVHQIDNHHLSGLFEKRCNSHTVFRIQHHNDCKWTEFVEEDGEEVKRNAIEQRGKALIARMSENRKKKLREIIRLDTKIQALAITRSDEEYIRFIELLEQEEGVDV